MNINKDKIAEFIYLIKRQNLKPFYKSNPNYNPDYDPEILFNDLPILGDGELIDRTYLYEIADYLIDIYLINFEKRYIDEIIETLAIFFSRTHSDSILGIDRSKEICLEEYGFSLMDKDWEGYNWEKLPEKTRKKNEVDRIFFREISKYFIENILEYPLPKPASRYDIDD